MGVKKHFKKAQKEPSLREIGKRFLIILIILGVFVGTMIVFFWWLSLRRVLFKGVFYVGFGCLFLLILGLFIFFVLACVRYLQTEVNRQKTVFKQAIRKVKGDDNGN